MGRWIKVGRWSLISEIRTPDSIEDALELVRIWSIREWPLLANLVAFVMQLKKPFVSIEERYESAMGELVRRFILESNRIKDSLNSWLESIRRESRLWIKESIC